jgi:quercetin dioxygenase-like cupin family protein
MSMQDVNRRDMLVAMSAFAALGGLAQAQAGPDGKLSKSRVFSFDELKPVESPTTSVGRAVMQGTLPTGEFIEVHETMLPPGKMPHPAHRHAHSELVLVREGTLEFYDDGKPTRMGPGGISFAASNVMHGLKNVGDTPANYFVVAIGVQVKG